ncbi:MAG: Hpt domain [Acidobacteriota bacterium]|nr:Hpt domain [Acidobacteriota bacterium]
MNELRDYYRESSRARLEELRAAFDRGDVDELRRHFHAFSGMGGTYGFPRISLLGDEAEGLLQSPDAVALARCRELMDEIARELC